MRKYIIGFTCGVLFGAAVPAAAAVIGGSGYLCIEAAKVGADAQPCARILSKEPRND